MLITWFTIKLAKIDWIWKSVGSLRNDLDRVALEGILGSLSWHKNLWFNLLISSSLLMSDLLSCTSKLEQASCFIRVLFCITGIARVDGVIQSTDPIFASGHELWYRHIYHTCAFRMSNMWGKDTLHSNGGCPRLDAIHAAAWRMYTVFIVNGNVRGRFRDVLAQKVRFSAGTLTTFRKSLSVNRVAPTSYYKESRL
jgi:hypothetical protein